MELKNSKGNPVTGYPVLRKQEYWNGKYYANNPKRPVPDFDRWLVDANRDGFDIHKIIIRKISLAKGTHIIRYGGIFGRFTAPYGTPYDHLSLPWEEDSCEFHEYVVCKRNIKVSCIVDKGYVAPGFEQPGGGIQYLHELTIKECLDLKLLKEVN